MYISFQRIVFFVFVVLFSVILIHNFFTNSTIQKWFKEPFLGLYPENAPGDKEDDPDDEFFKKMNSEVLPTSQDIENMVIDLDTEVVLSPEEEDFIDDNEIELPESNVSVGINSLKQNMIKKQEQYDEEQEEGEEEEEQE